MYADVIGPMKRDLRPPGRQNGIHSSAEFRFDARISFKKGKNSIDERHYLSKYEKPCVAMARFRYFTKLI